MGASQLVQAALRKYVARPEGKSPFARTPSEESRALLSETVRRVTEGARGKYDEGYRVGLEFAASSPWDLLEILSQSNWDLRTWLSDYAQACDDKTREWIDFQEVEGAMILGGPAKAEGAQFEEQIKETQTLPCMQDSIGRLGFADALRDVWNEVTGQSDDDRSLDPDDVPFE
jgi:hypothetical protein